MGFESYLVGRVCATIGGPEVEPAGRLLLVTSAIARKVGWRGEECDSGGPETEMYVVGARLSCSSYERRWVRQALRRWVRSS
jgi:hypothetical protein